MRIPLARLCSARSGDKGETIDVSLFARDAETIAWIDKQLPPSGLQAYFAPLGVTRVQRWSLPTIAALKYVLHGALPGGAARTLRGDNLGKTLGAAFLRLEIEAPPGWEEHP